MEDRTINTRKQRPLNPAEQQLLTAIGNQADPVNGEEAIDDALLAEVAKSPEVDSLTRYQLQQFSQRRRRLELHAQFVK